MDKRNFVPLSLDLANYFNCEMVDLPVRLKERVLVAFKLFHWDKCTVEQRKSRAKTYDEQNDPGWAVHQQFWLDITNSLHEIQHKRNEWSKVAATTASDKQIQIEKISELDKRESHVRQTMARLEQRTYPRYQNKNVAIEEHEDDNWLSLVAAERLLKGRLGASLPEIAAWVELGPDNGGLKAYTESNELEFFYFTPDMGDDYLGALHTCRFRENDVLDFSPQERYLSGSELLDCIRTELDDNTRAYMIAQISNNVLLDIHPSMGVTDAGIFSHSGFPSLEEGLFLASQIKALNVRDGWKLHWPKRFADSNKQPEKPNERKARLHRWYDEEVSQNGKNGALKRTAAREGITSQTLRSILNREK